ncbi:NAD-dependent isocitrate dehydrogenase [Aspergillus wentii]|nr:NAD-dependent isocitrate dehydrogenase [Aspergillus wentii]
MISARTFIAPARQCLRTTRVSPSVVSPFSQFRRYSAAVDERVAKFKGQKDTDGKYTVTLIEGDGIGPEIAQSVKDIFSAANLNSGPYQVGTR